MQLHPFSLQSVIFDNRGVKGMLFESRTELAFKGVMRKGGVV